MEREWEHRNQRPRPTWATLSAALSPLGRGEPVDAEPLRGGLVNLNLEVAFESPHEPVVLRVHLRDTAAAAKEAALFDALEGDVPAPRVLHAGTIHLDESERAFLVLSRLPGERLADLLPDAGDAVARRAGGEVGHALARLHAHRRDAIGFLDTDLRVAEPMDGLRATWRGYLESRLDGRAGDRAGPDRCRRIRQVVATFIDELEPLESDACLLHGDCKPTNVLARPDGSLSGFVDWEFAWAGPALFDIGQMLRWPQPQAYVEAFLDAYVSDAGPLPDDWRRLSRLVDLVNLVGFLDAEADWPVRERDACRLIDGTLDALG